MTTDIEVQFDSGNQPQILMADQDPAVGSISRWIKRRPCLAIATATPLLWLVGAVVAVGATLLLAMPVLLPLIYIILHSLPKKTHRRFLGLDGDDHHERDGDEGIAGMYNQSRRQQTLWARITKGSFRILARASIGTLAWLFLSLSVPRFKDVEILSSPMWKWSLLGVILTAGYFQGITSIMPLMILPRYLCKTDETPHYYVRAMFTSMINVAYFGMVMVSWLAYFRTHHGLRQETTPHPQAFEYVTWSLVSLFVGSFLWMIKAFLIAKWSADAIYRRFKPRIFVTSLKFFFIGLCAASFYEGRIIKGLGDCSDTTEEKDAGGRPANPSKFSASIMPDKMGLSHLTYVSRILTHLAEIMSPLLDRDDEKEEIVNWFDQQIKDNTTDTCTPEALLKLFHRPYCEENIQAESSQEIFQILKRMFAFKEKRRLRRYKEMHKNNPKMANILFGLVREECSSPHFTFHDLKIWMVDAHKDCTNMGRTLADASAMVNRLDLFMSCVIIVIVVLLWLLMTGVSSTTVIVTVATPFLALTFMFGDTAKTFFQGFVFCFGIHPFDVGDRCILDETELEVKSVSILTTTFMKVGSKEKRLYPNSVLATKAIVNFGWLPDPRDVIELIVDSSTNIKTLEAKIKRFLTKKKLLYNDDSWELIVKEVGENNKVEIQFTHVLTVHDLSHNQCFKKKSKQKSYFLKKLKKYIKESQTDQVYPSKYTQLLTKEIKESEI